MNRDWVVSINHQGEQPQALQEEGGSGATTYNNQFSLIPGHLHWRAEQPNTSRWSNDSHGRRS
ncbi:hypothetical protein WI664_07560 [Vibrio cholerae]